MSADHLLPLPRSPRQRRNLRNAGNTCYLSSILVALFADFDALDGLLQAATPLTHHLTRVVNLVRSAQPVRPDLVRALRTDLVSSGWPRGSAQQDAAEFLAFLLDALSAPFLPLYDNLLHARRPDPADHLPSTERLLWLDLPAQPPHHTPTLPLRALLDDYFFGQTRPGLRRQGVGVDAAVAKSLLPFYTPVRETGETVRAPRHKFPYLTVPLALRRFREVAGQKNKRRVHIPTALDCTEYVNHFAQGPTYSLMLRSVVCHRGQTISAGHYVAYTYAPRTGWSLWNDLDERPVRSVRGNVRSGEPEDRAWADEIATDSYLLFYELVPGDSELDSNIRRREMQVLADAYFAAQRQVEEDARGAREVMAAEGELLDHYVPA